MNRSRGPTGAPGTPIRILPGEPLLHPPRESVPHDHAADVHAICEALDSLLDGPGRRDIIDRVTRGGRLPDALRRLRMSMSAHGFEGLPTDVGRTIRHLDQRTRQDGFRALHAWNHTTHAFTDDLVPVLMVDFFERAEVEDADVSTTVSILLDYYLLHLLALAAMRAWDTDDPGVALDRVTRLLELLQGPDGSGHRFVSDSETLLIHALSQFHPEEQAYDRIIEKVDSLPAGNRVRFARVSAAVLGAHLRWGFWLMYERDVQRMRDDNVGDYPWLLWTVTTLLREWVRLVDEGGSAEERRPLAGSLLLALSADPWAFGGRPPAALEPLADTYAECRALLEAHADRLLSDFEALRPSKDAYAPLSLLFNFPHNALVAGVTLALLEGRPRTLSLDDLFEEERAEGTSEEGEGEEAARVSKQDLARALMEFSRGSSDRLGYRGAMLVAYDPLTAIRTFSMTRKALREALD